MVMEAEDRGGGRGDKDRRRGSEDRGRAEKDRPSVFSRHGCSVSLPLAVGWDFFNDRFIL